VATYTNEDLAALTEPPAFHGDDPSNLVEFISVTPPSVDLSTATFVDWDDDTDFVEITGADQDVALAIIGSIKKDRITGGASADEIDAGDGDDTIIGFTEGDVVDGGSGNDTLVLGVSTTIADNDALSGVEAVTAADAEDGVVLDLGGQAEGFVITGSA
jgi:Ca2+-binding RTX toxin-like protein